MSLFLGSCQEARKNSSRWSRELLDLVHISLGGLGVTWLLKGCAIWYRGRAHNKQYLLRSDALKQGDCVVEGHVGALCLLSSVFKNLARDLARI